MIKIGYINYDDNKMIGTTHIWGNVYLGCTWKDNHEKEHLGRIFQYGCSEE